MNEATQTANTIIQEKEAADLGQMLKHIPEAERVALLYTAKILAAIATTPAASRANGVEITMTDAQYTDMLTQRGASELEQYAETLNFASKVNTNTNLQYEEDFNLGDRVTCVNKRWGIKINVRITEVMETYQQGKTNIDITFGESLPTLIEQIRKLR